MTSFHGVATKSLHKYVGWFRWFELNKHGNLSLEIINRFHCDHAFITVGGIDLNGNCMDYNVDEAGIAQAMIQQARSVTILVDYSKIGRKALCTVCNLSNISRLITDKKPSDEFITQLEINEVELIIAD